MTLVKIYDAPKAFKCLNGIINVFKPAGMKVNHVKTAILYNLCKDLNNMIVREPRKTETVMLEPGGAQNPVLRKVASLSDHILAVGPRYQMEDIRCAPVASLGVHTSGVLLLGINKGLKQSSKIHQNRPIRVYHVTGCLGTATESHFQDSLVTVSAKHGHVHAERISGLASSLQASHQRKMFELCGVDLQSQAAYEMACKGLIRPAENTLPVIYGIKLVEFQRPLFTLEIHAINETEDYLATLIHEIGIELRTVAHCQAIRCVRHGKFIVDNALLRHGWNLPGVLKNMRQQKEVIEKHPYLLNQDKIELRN